MGLLSKRAGSDSPGASGIPKHKLGADLQQEAQKQGVSLNQYLVYILARYGLPKETDKPEK
jgi:hypothetical protein